VLADAGTPGTTATVQKIGKDGAVGTKQVGLTIEQWQVMADRSVRWKESVDRALAALGLDKREVVDVWDAYYRGLLPPAVPPAQLKSCAGQANGIADGPKPAAEECGTPRGQIPQAENNP
jgi:hypothetical protein